MAADLHFFGNLSRVILEHGRWSLRAALPFVLAYFAAVVFLGWIVRSKPNTGETDG